MIEQPQRRLSAPIESFFVKWRRKLCICGQNIATDTQFIFVKKTFNVYPLFGARAMVLIKIISASNNYELFTTFVNPFY
jgi:hypothetical protein